MKILTVVTNMMICGVRPNVSKLWRGGMAFALAATLLGPTAKARNAPAIATSATSATSARAAEAKHDDAAAAKPTTGDACVLTNGIRLQDEIVVVNTRSICGTCSPDSLRSGMQFETYSIKDEAGYRSWQRTDLDSFLAFDPAVPTIIFVHGNLVTAGDAKCEGLSVYRKLISQGCESSKIRFVIFSWPSSKTSGLLRDVRTKAVRTGPAGYQLAWLLDQMQPETPVSLVGFSFGARIITGGLHILAGGSLGGSLALSEHVHANRDPVNVVLMSAAIHSCWLGEGQYHGLAMTQVNRMLSLNNCQDRAMRYYDLLTPGRGGPSAVGEYGPKCLSHEYAQKVFNRDVSRYVGSQHDLMRIICSRGSASLIWDYSGGTASSSLAAK